MVAPSATIEVYVDGVRLPSTPADLAADRVTALDGLRLTWGRDGQNEQPGPSTCTFGIADRLATVDFLDTLHVGSTVDVWAAGSIPGEVTRVTTYDNGSFVGIPDGPAAGLGLVSGFTNFSRIIDETVGQDFPGQPLTSVYFPPRALSPLNELPDAWDSIPQAHNGETWTIRARVKAPPGVRYSIRPGGYENPWSYALVSFTALPTPPNQTGTGDWQNLEFTFTIAGLVGPMWVAVRMNYLTLPWTGRTWAEQPGTWAEQTTTWADPRWVTETFFDDFAAFPPASGTTRRVLTFTGDISDVLAVPDGTGGLRYSVTAADLGADLGQRVVGDTPWPVQTVTVRAQRIAELAGIPVGPQGQPRVRIDEPLGALQLSARDVDAQPAHALLQDVAQSAGGVLWAATHALTGAFLWIENPATRAAVRQLELSGGLISVTAAADGRGVVTVSACDLLEEPVTWAQDTADVVSVVAVTWAEQGPPGDDGLPTVTERTVTVTDAPAVALYGTRRLSISTELISAADATSYANRVLAQARAVGWRLDGLTWDTAQLADTLPTLDDATRQVALLDLLDGTTRMGLAVTLVDMPSYAPRGAISSVYVDGGTYTYTDDAWELSLATTPSAGQGGSATWAELDPTWRWQQWAPAVQWVDLYGVAA